MSPELAAILGAIGGATVAVLGTLGEARRRERREVRAARRLLVDEFGQARSSITFALTENDWGALEPLRLANWERLSQVCAAGLRPAAWNKVVAAARAVELVSRYAGSVDGSRRIYPCEDPDAPPDADLTELEGAKREIDEAIGVLGGGKPVSSRA